MFITNWFKHYSPDYQGGYLEYFTTDNGGCFVVPYYEGKKKVEILSKFFSDEMFAEAAML